VAGALRGISQALQNSILLLLVAVLSERLEQPQAASQSKSGLAWDACATWPDGVQGTVSSLSADLDFPDTVQLNLLTLRDFLSQRLEVAFDRFTDKFLGERSFLACYQGYPIGVFHRDFSFEMLKTTLER
jgi:hypothetical protein